MKNKILIIGIAIVILVIALVFIARKNNNSHNGIDVNGIYSQYKGDVDSGVEAFRKSETFNEMNEANQIKKMNNLLKIYEDNGIIKNLHYDDANKLFSFIYNSGEIKGTLGGVSLKKWNPMMN